MIGISKLYCGTVEASDPLRYQRHSGKLPSHLLQFSEDKKPVVVFNCTKRCNLRCIHCYSSSDNSCAPDELSDAEAMTLIDDLAAFGSPVLLFSGGEPLMRPGVLDLATYARSKGLRVVLSTNGNLITPELAARFKEIDLSYVGISLDGATPEVNDHFRGKEGAFVKALAAIRFCREAGVKVGLRLTMSRQNARDIEAIFDLLEREDIPRVCFYHLVSAGRGGQMGADALSSEETRTTLDTILRRTRECHDAGKPLEVLTVDNHADGAYLYLKLLQEDPAKAADVYKLLQMNGGNGSGISIGCVSWNGDVHPDQFWRTKTVGNVRTNPFSEIWTSPDTPLLPELRRRKELLECRCQRCRFLDICNGNLRARSDYCGNGTWGDDPGCYLTDEEITE